MMILAVSRRLPQLLELQRERTWQPLEGAELRDVTVGIVGLGSIGRAVGAPRDGLRLPGRGGRAGAARGRRRPAADDAEDASSASSMLDRVGGPETLPELLAESDFIVLAAPLTPGDRGDDQRRDAGHGQAGRLAHQRRARPAGRRAGPAPRAARRRPRRRRPRHVPGRAAAADLAVLRPAERDRHAAHRRGRAAGSSTAASSCSATTCAASRPASRCSTWSTRAPGTDPGDNPLDADRHRRACRIGQDHRLQHADPRPRRDRRLRRGHRSTSASSRCPTRGSTRWPRSSSPRRSSRPTSPTPTCRRRRRRPRATSGPRSCRPTTSPGCATRTRCSTSSAPSRTRPTRIPAGSVDPARDLEQLDLEFLLADLAMAERRIERLKTSARHGNPAEREAAEREDAVLRAHPRRLSRRARRSATSTSTPTTRRRSAASAS